MHKKLSEIWEKTDDVFIRYPMVLAMAFIASVSAFVGISLDNLPNQFLVTKFCFVAVLGISLMFGIKMLSQRIGKELILEILGTAFLIWLYFYLPDTEAEFTEVYAFVLIPLFILSHLFVSFAAYLNQKPEISFWEYNKNLFINIILTAIFTGVLVGGIMLAIAAVDNLFELDLDRKIYPKTFFLFAIFGSAFIFLLFDGNGLKHLEREDKYPNILKFFTQFILIPLLIIYVLILYLYSSKILLRWELPRGWVSYLILAYAIVGILALLLVYPLKANSTKSWVKIFSKIFYYTIIPLLVLLFVAIYTRILEYGYTEPRYYVLLLAIWLTMVVFYFIFSRKPTIKFIPISLFTLGVCSLIFPYFNVFSVSKRSQKNEVTQILYKNNLLVNGKIDFQKKVSSEVADEIGNKIGFLVVRKDTSFLDQFLNTSTIAEIKKSSLNRKYMIASLITSKFTNTLKDNSQQNGYQIELTAEEGFKSLDGYQYFNWINGAKSDFNLNQDHFVIEAQLHQKNKVYRVILNDSKEVNLLPELEKIINENKPNSKTLTELSLTSEIGKYQFKIFFKRIAYGHFSQEEDNIYLGDSMILVKEK